jgi:hypothetical protein
MMRVPAFGGLALGTPHPRASVVGLLPATGHAAIAMEPERLREELRRLSAAREADPSGQREDTKGSSQGVTANHSRLDCTSKDGSTG